MKKVIRESVTAASVGVGGTVLVVGVTSAILAPRFWLAELLVNFQVHYLACLLACLFLLVLLRRQLTAAIFLFGALFLALPVIPYLKLPFGEETVLKPADDERFYRTLTYNVLQGNTRTQDVADFIATQRIDFLLLLETDKSWSDEMEFELRDHYLHRFTKPRSDHQGITFYSKHPWKSIRLVEELEEPTLEAIFDLPEGTLTILGVHPLPPIRPALASRRNDFLRRLGEHAASFQDSLIVMGDFNVTPWSPHFKNLLHTGLLEDSAVGRGLQNTWYRFPILFCGIPIDHALLRSVALNERFIGPPMGSDHRPLFLEFLVEDSSR